MGPQGGMSADPRKDLIERLFREQSGRLWAFLGRRLRQRSDIGELVQEVFLRMLRVEDIKALRSPEAYLYTVARNLLKERAAQGARAQRTLDVGDPCVQEQLAELPALDADIDSQARIKQLREVLRELPPKCHLAVVLYHWHHMSSVAIAAQLKISPQMVRKYLSQAVVHCRRRMGRLG